MRFTSSILFRPAAGLLLLLGLAGPVSLAPLRAAPESGIALVVVFDTSGSMNQPLRSNASRAGAESRFVVAQRALGLVIDRLVAFRKTPAAPPLSVGITTFQKQDAAVALPLAPFDPVALRRWLSHARADSATPLGNAIYLAGQELLAAPAASRHLLVLTDGANTVGRTPESVLAQLNKAAEKKQVSFFTHIIALDIAPATFAALKQQGATLLGATDEAQLNSQFDFILEEKILVEASR